MGAQRLVDMGFYGYRGWGDTEAEADFRATGGSGKGGPTSSGASSGANVTPQSFTQNPVQSAIDIAKSLRQENITAAQPAIQTLQEGTQPLKDRYAKLIADIKGRRETAVQQTGISTATEFGKRGIPLSSGAYDVALRQAQTPVEQAYGGLITGAEGEQEDKLAAIRSAIAGLQSGAGNVNMSDVLSILTTSKALSTPTNLDTETITAGGRKLLINKQTGATIADLGATETSSGGNDLASLVALLGGGTGTPTEPKPTAPPSSKKSVTPSAQRGGYGYPTYYG